MRRALLAVWLAACAGDPPAQPPPAEPPPNMETPAPAAHAEPSAVPAPPVDAARAPTTLRAAGYARIAEIIEARVAQTAPKMKLSPTEGSRAAGFALSELNRSPPLRELAAVMPHSVVELARAIGERGLARGEADRIATYLARLTSALAFERLERFDINHSHVTGRRWREIDYRGENMTWQSQQAYWGKRGVADFRRAEHIHAYMRGAYRLPHFARVYRPRGRFSAVSAP